MNRIRILVALLALPVASASAAGLGGSRASLREAYEIARANDYTFLRTPAQIRDFVKSERLEEVKSSEHLLMNNVSFPYTRPILRLFIERLAEQYHAATGARLVVTSLTRPTSQQPRNASRWSVHPAGMAVDLRIPAVAAHRGWLEATLLSLEDRQVLDVTRERRPPHYHVAVFPEQYGEYLARLPRQKPAAPATPPSKAEPTPVIAAAAHPAASGPPFPLLGFVPLAAGALLLLGAGATSARRVWDVRSRG